VVVQFFMHLVGSRGIDDKRSIEPSLLLVEHHQAGH